MLRSPENNPETESHHSLAEWVNQVMVDYGVPEAERQRLQEYVDRLPQDSRLLEVLQSDNTHEFKLGSLDASFLNWRDQGTLPKEFLPLVEVIQHKANEVGLK